MRGKADPELPDNQQSRITPAYAGKRKHEADVQFLFQDHPRLCGEKFSASYILNFVLGSPPPMRGKDLQKRLQHLHQRITPAYAGKRSANQLRGYMLQDHPRLCGEKSICYDSTRPRPGSPPPMRGKEPVKVG